MLTGEEPEPEVRPPPAPAVVMLAPEAFVDRRQDARLALLLEEHRE